MSEWNRLGMNTCPFNVKTTVVHPISGEVVEAWVMCDQPALYGFHVDVAKKRVQGRLQEAASGSHACKKHAMEGIIRAAEMIKEL